jgi:DNA-binding LacI/PurR family transcriptional regulator
MPITMTDIARKAGVSQPVVSAVLNNNYKNCRVSEEKKKNILKIAEQLHFTPNAVAQSLATKKTNIINVVIPSATFFQFYNYSTIIAGLQEFADEAGYRITFTSLSQGYKDYKSLNGIIADGVIVFYWSEVNDPVVREIKKMGHPFLAAYGRCEQPGTHNLFFDGYTPFYNLTRQLIDRGHTRLGYAPSYTGDVFHQDEYRGICQAVKETKGVTLREYRMDPMETRLPHIQDLFLAGKQAIREIAGDLDVTCLMFNHDIVAVGVLQEAKKLGIRVPEDVSITSCNNDPVSQMIEPNLTTIDFKPEEYGRQLGTMLVDMISGKKVKNKKQAFIPEPVFRDTAKTLK